MNWYVYSNNNPVMFVDSWGLAAGDPFESINAAVSDMYTCYYGITDYTQLEIGSVVYSYQDNGTVYYSYTEPTVGEPDSIGLVELGDDVPNQGVLEAYVHTHASMNDDMDSIAETFSAVDYSFTCGKDVPLYLLTKNGNAYMLPGRDSVIAGSISSTNRYDGTLIMSGMTFNPIEDEETKKQYALEYGQRWVNHLAENSKLERENLGGSLPEYYSLEMHRPTLMVVRQLEMLNDYLDLTGKELIKRE